MHRLLTVPLLLIPIACSSTDDFGAEKDDPEGIEVKREAETVTDAKKDYTVTKAEQEEFSRIWELYRKKDPRWARERDRYKRKGDGPATYMAGIFLRYYMEVNADRSHRAKELVAVKNEIVAVGKPCAPYLSDLMVLDRIKRPDGTYFLTDDITRGDCMDMLERMGSESVPDLLKVLERKDLGVKGRRLTASTLGGTRDPRAFDPLVKLLQEDPSWQVRADACTGLGKLGDRRAIQYLNQAIMTDKDPAVRKRANKARRQIARGGAGYP
ncbi:MAG: HEAT repeat domain-containing protein [Planctomycetota bacterium]|jgi:hypothetical protein